MIRQLCLIASLWVSVSIAGFAQTPNSGGELPRRGWFGVALASHESGAVVTAVVPGSTAAAEGIRVGDVIRAVDDIVPRSPNDVVAAIARHAPGTSVVIDLLREGSAQRRPVVLQSLPQETMPGAVFEYGAVTLADGSRLRTILSVPERREGKLPAVMLLQGGSCGSLDVPMAPDFAQPGLMRSIGAHGLGLQFDRHHIEAHGAV